MNFEQHYKENLEKIIDIFFQDDKLTPTSKKTIKTIFEQGWGGSKKEILKILEQNKHNVIDDNLIKEIDKL